MGAELVGLMAAGVVLVEGAPGTPEAFTDVESEAVSLAVVRAELMLGRLARSASPNHFLQCSFFNFTQSVVIAPGFIDEPTNTTGNQALRDSQIFTREAQWRAPAMAALGFPSPAGGPDPVDQFCDSLVLRDWGVPHKPRRAFALLVTKFPTGWMAYASVGGNRLTLQFDWLADTSGDFRGTGAGGYGVENLDRVIAHEMGHIFGGLDEYKNCKPAETGGPLNTPNGNCEKGNPASVDCLMKNNTENLCSFSVSHVGWVDTDLDGVVDAAAPQPTSLSPTSGVAGDVVTITGFGLGETRSVVFTGVGAADFTIVSDTQLDVTVPDGSGPDRDVFVTSTFGISRPDPAVQFTYV